MAIGSFRSGKGGRFRFDNTNLKGRKWSVAEEGNDLDTTNFECFTEDYGSTGAGGGRSFTQGLIGLETASCNYEGSWDAATNPFDDPPAIYARDDGPLCQLYINQVDNNYYEFAETRVLTASVDCAVDGLVSFNFSFKNQGPWSRPAGSFS